MFACASHAHEEMMCARVCVCVFLYVQSVFWQTWVSKVLMF